MSTSVRTLAASLAAIAASLAAHSAHATGLAAGTVISNTASATYGTGTGTSTISSNTVTVKVDQLIDVTVAGLNGSPVPASSSAAVLSYSVGNTGNGPSTFALAADPAITGNTYNGTVQSIVIDSNGNGTYDPGVDTVYTPGSVTPSIASDASLKVFVIVALPSSGSVDGQTSQIKLTATSSIGSGAPGTLLAGAGTGGVDAVIGSSGGTAKGFDSIIASLAAVTLAKAATVADPFGGATPVPGAVVTYTITAHVTGSGSAANLHIIDAIPGGTTYQAGTLKLGATALTDAPDTDAGQGSQASGIDVGLGTVAGGSADQTVSFKVKIN